MKKLERKEMKNLKGGVSSTVDPGDGGPVPCISACGVYHQAGCAGVDHDACSTGSGAFAWRCCTKGVD